MKTYEVEVNGQTYVVKLTEITEGAAIEKLAAKPAAPAPTPAPVAASPTPAPVATGDGEVVPAPMAGLVLSVAKNVGDPVKKGDILLILEAMKMENEILAPSDGVVKSILVSANQSVESNQPLMTI